MASTRRPASDGRLHPRAAALTACESCALTLGIPVYVPVARADAHAAAHTDAYACTAVTRALAGPDADAVADR